MWKIKGDQRGNFISIKIVKNIIILKNLKKYAKINENVETKFRKQ